ncbi:MAG: DUF4845 domain-containing protein [Pseudomonadota bacterium]
MKKAQRGISFIGLLLVAGIVVFGGVLAAQAVPTVIEFQAALKAANKAATGSTVAEVRSLFDKASQIDDISSVSAKDLVITKEGEKTVVSFAYNKEIHVAGPVFFLIKYAGRSK